VRPGADEDGARRVDAVQPREREGQPRQRRPAPASRRAGGVRAHRGLHRSGDVRGEAGGVACERIQVAVGAPVEDQVRRVAIALFERLLPAGLPQRGGRDEDSRPTSRGWRAREGHLLHGRESFVDGRRLELAEGAHLRRRRVDARLTPRRPAQLFGSRKGAETLEQPLDEVDLRLGERRVEPSHSTSRVRKRSLAGQNLAGSSRNTPTGSPRSSTGPVSAPEAVARMARFGVRSGAVAFAHLNGQRCKQGGLSERARTGANGRSHLPCRRSWVRVPSSALNALQSRLFSYQI
jgi:hypothetical protein